MLETIDLGAVTTRGYGFQIEVTYRALRAGFRVVELPITFVDRRVGQSKMSGAIVVEAMRQVPLLRARALAAVCSLTAMDVTDATFPDEVLALGRPGDRRLLGAVVPAVPGDRAAARGHRRRAARVASSSSA